MSLYLDASVLVPLVVQENSTGSIVALLQRQVSPPMVSDFAQAEVGAAVSRLVRMGRLSTKVGEALLARFDLWRAREAVLLPVEPDDIRTAGDLVRDFELRLRTPDALHLAIARRLGVPLTTLDKALARAAGLTGSPHLMPA